jgi:hypothetical protein
MALPSIVDVIRWDEKAGLQMERDYTHYNTDKEVHTESIKFSHPLSPATRM